MAEITVAVAQLAPVIGDVEGNRERACAAIAAADADLVVLPELMTTGYVFESEEEARALARTTEEAVAAWSEVAGDRVVVGGYAELGEDGRVYNSSALVDRRGVGARYRKVHLWDAEKLVFSAGQDFPPVVQTEIGRIALAVCYDVEFPELVRGLALSGADILALPVNWPRFPQPEGERPMDVVRVMAAAATNRIFIAVADRCGEERGVDWVSGTCIAGPDGWLLAGPPERGEPVTLTAGCDLALARDKRINERNDVLGDRRPDVYAKLNGF
jgi:predicted amidohydrolase